MIWKDVGKILSNKKIGEDSQGRSIYKIKLQNREIAQEAMPGQFITIQCYGGTFFRRPFSIACTEKRRFLYVLYKVVGNGTRWLSQCKAGDEIAILGPLGKKPFVIKPDIKNPILVAGGMGAAPLIFLCQKLLISTNCDPLFLIGADRKSAIIRLPTKSKRVEIITSTQDGSLGYEGNITEVLDEKLSRGNGIVYAAGPLGCSERHISFVKSTEFRAMSCWSQWLPAVLAPAMDARLKHIKVMNATRESVLMAQHLMQES